MSSIATYGYGRTNSVAIYGYSGEGYIPHPPIYHGPFALQICNIFTKELRLPINVGC